MSEIVVDKYYLGELGPFFALHINGTWVQTASSTIELKLVDCKKFIINEIGGPHGGVNQ